MLSMPKDISSYWVLWASVVFLIKHYVADFLLQTNWIARGKEAAHGWLAPLSAHAAVHAAFTAAIFAWAAPAHIWLAAVDFVVHFAIDKAKSDVSRPFKLDPKEGLFWWLLGLDQLLHYATHLVFVLVIAAANT